MKDWRLRLALGIVSVFLAACGDRTFVRLDGQNGIHFDFASHTVDTGLRNFMRFTSRFGRILRFNVNATKAEFPVIENALPSGMQSINLGRELSIK